MDSSISPIMIINPSKLITVLIANSSTSLRPHFTSKPYVINIVIDLIIVAAYAIRVTINKKVHMTGRLGATYVVMLLLCPRVYY